MQTQLVALMPVCKKSGRLCVNTIYPLLRVIEMTNAYYALDTVGFVTEPAVIAERVLADYLSTNYSQSIIFFGSLKSLQRTIQANTGNMDLTSAAIQSDLESLFTRYLDNVVVNVTNAPIKNNFGNETDRYEIFIDVSFSTGKGMESLATTIRQTNEGFIRIASLVSN